MKKILLGILLLTSLLAFAKETNTSTKIHKTIENGKMVEKCERTTTINGRVEAKSVDCKEIKAAHQQEMNKINAELKNGDRKVTEKCTRTTTINGRTETKNIDCKEIKAHINKR